MEMQNEIIEKALKIVSTSTTHAHLIGAENYVDLLNSRLPEEDISHLKDAIKKRMNEIDMADLKIRRALIGDGLDGCLG